LSFYEGIGVGIGVLKIEESESEVLKIEESESELLCTYSTAVLLTIALYTLVITALVYDNIKYSVPFMKL
jgi:hypothetical protein